MTDRAALEQLLNRYSYCYDTADFAAMKNLFAEDASFSMIIAGGDKISFAPRTAIMDLMTNSAASQTDQRRHINSNLLVDEEPDGSVRTTSYLTLVATENGAIQLLSAGVYRAHIVEQDGELRFASLHLDLDKAY